MNLFYDVLTHKFADLSETCNNNNNNNTCDLIEAKTNIGFIGELCKAFSSYPHCALSMVCCPYLTILYGIILQDFWFVKS